MIRDMLRGFGLAIGVILSVQAATSLVEERYGDFALQSLFGLINLYLFFDSKPAQPDDSNSDEG